MVIIISNKKNLSRLVDLNSTQLDKSIPLLSDFVILKDKNFYFIGCLSRFIFT